MSDIVKFKHIINDENYWIHCNNENDAKILCQKMHDAGLCWSNGKPYVKNDTVTNIIDSRWNCYGEQTCYRSISGDVDELSSIESCGLEYKIIPFENVVFNECDDFSPNMVNRLNDMVNHPPHYKTHEMECIDEMVFIFGIQATIDFCKCNAWKYRYRAGSKGSASEDLKKSDWYVNKAKELQSRQ